MEEGRLEYLFSIRNTLFAARISFLQPEFVIFVIPNEERDLNAMARRLML